jgi:hypothetical protein
MIEMHITFDEGTGDVNVTGCINNKGLCYLMLECARDAVKDHVDNLQKTIVPAPANGLSSFIRGRGKRRR